MEKQWTAVVEFRGDRSSLPESQMVSIAESLFPALTVFTLPGKSAFPIREDDGTPTADRCVGMYLADPSNPAIASGDLAAFGPTVQG